MISENSVNLGIGKNKVKSVLRTLIEKMWVSKTAEADFLTDLIREIGFKSET